MTGWGGNSPGETPIDDLSGLKIPGITTRAELNACEAANITKVVEKYLVVRPSEKLAKFDFGWSLRLHREMFGDVWNWAGKIRNQSLNIGVPAHTISEQLENVLRDLPVWRESGMAMIEQAARLHHRTVLIHPFVNGNGRWSRMLANIWLKLHRHPLTIWPEQFTGDQSPARNEYIAAIQRADALDYSALIELHKRFTDDQPLG